jgi:hypothetical protein
MDLLQREGHYPVPPQASPILGVEFSGTIDSLGEGCKDGFSIGDEVFGLAYGGAYAEYIAVSTHMLLHKPSHLSWEEAAGIPEVSHFSLSQREEKKIDRLDMSNARRVTLDLDYSHAGNVPCWGIHQGKEHPLACWRLQRFYLRDPALQNQWGIHHICNRRVAGED